ncbi:Uncharacterised protein [Mycobacteroides abscessus]|nr:Uncharacterised protein [Mycobacteroides abscessus]SHQ37088.1 Uncharacterised protein [Mycobacteroides abscessus subsp. abscessus]CPS50650.1 Uncharacterised protein [Mycobacteroides abscessus]CPS93531.1 Uncharacterised protein [Mycobacteroides abscessus]CPS94426.1 Uncharacterised protein [Mycobacteroides abscessus]
MGRLRDATPSNRDASLTIQRELLQKVRSRINGARLALKRASGAEHPGTVLARLTEFRRAHREIDELCMELAGVAILGGMTATEVSKATGISASTLTRRVPKSLTALRGRHITRDATAPHGWRER